MSDEPTLFSVLHTVGRTRSVMYRALYHSELGVDIMRLDTAISNRRNGKFCSKRRTQGGTGGVDELRVYGHQGLFWMQVKKIGQANFHLLPKTIIYEQYNKVNGTSYLCPP